MMSKSSDLIALLVCIFSVGHSYIRTDLNGDNWQVTDDRKAIMVKACAPGSVYTTLLQNKLIQDPLFRDNDVKYAWIGLENWTYSSTFSLSTQAAKSNVIILVCEGLDTVASVEVNGKMLGMSDNMFTRYKFDLGGVVKRGNNSIRISFQSAVSVAAARANQTYPIPPECPTQWQNGMCHVNMIRKEQCSFSWDWGPSFPTQGIWKSIYIESFNSAVLQNVAAVVRKVNSEWVVDVEASFHGSRLYEVKGRLEAEVQGLGLSFSKDVTVSPVQMNATFQLKIPKTTSVPLWWPNGYGSQPLFNLSVTFKTLSETSSRTIRIGFRTVELIQDPVSNNTEHGLTFYFRVNGLPIFLKGSNWIPADSFQERITASRLRYLLQSSVDVGMNALRVWGGGVYESEDFYALADELGIMIWQDLMFSVAMYPSDAAFLRSVTTEVTQQIQRLKHHASIMLWAGNNENEKAIRDDWFETSKDFNLYYHDYLRLYVDTIKPIVEAADNSREYLASSPSNGKQSELEGYIAQNPASELYGDIHFYDYDADQWNSSVFRIPRMASEYGIQAWSNPQTLRAVFDPTDFSMMSHMATHRQHHADGNKQMIAEVSKHMKMPSSPDAKNNFLDFIYLTQINQAMSMRTQTEFYRRQQSKLQPDGRGLTMGALYWQLNDIWQAPTWASIDYNGIWKMLHYFAKSFFAPTIISPFFENKGSTVDVFMVIDNIPSVEERSRMDGALSFKPMKHFSDIVKSDLPLVSVFRVMQSVASGSSGFLKVHMYSYKSFMPLFYWMIPFHMETTAQSVFRSSVSNLLTESKCPSKKDCLLYFSSADHTGQPMATSWLSLTYPKDANLLNANTTVFSVVAKGSRKFEVEVRSDAIALFVWLSTYNIGGHFSDNGFLMVTPVTRVTFFSFENESASRIQAQLTVKSLSDVK